MEFFKTMMRISIGSLLIGEPLLAFPGCCVANTANSFGWIVKIVESVGGESDTVDSVGCGGEVVESPGSSEVIYIGARATTFLQSEIRRQS